MMAYRCPECGYKMTREKNRWECGYCWWWISMDVALKILGPVPPDAD